MISNYFKKEKYVLALLCILLLTACTKNDGNTKKDVDKTQSGYQKNKSVSEKETIQSSENIMILLRMPSQNINEPALPGQKTDIIYGGAKKEKII